MANVSDQIDDLGPASEVQLISVVQELPGAIIDPPSYEKIRAEWTGPYSSVCGWWIRDPEGAYMVARILKLTPLGLKEEIRQYNEDDIGGYSESYAGRLRWKAIQHRRTQFVEEGIHPDFMTPGTKLIYNTVQVFLSLCWIAGLIMTIFGLGYSLNGLANHINKE